MLGLAALVGAGATSQEGFEAIRDISPGRIAAIVALAACSTISAALTWRTLMLSAPGTIRDYLVIQGAKYLPLGGAAHGVGMAMSAARSGMKASTGMSRFLMHSAYHLVAALALASSLAYDAPLSVQLGLAVLLAVGASVFVSQVAESRGYIVGGSGTGVRCALSSLASLISAGLAFGLIIDAVRAPDLIPGFSLAWSVGFLAVPIPAGIVVRESVLVALGVGSIAEVAVASLVHRTLGVVADTVLAGVSLSTMRRGEK